MKGNLKNLVTVIGTIFLSLNEPRTWILYFKYGFFSFIFGKLKRLDEPKRSMFWHFDSAN
jgi:hypothetical protein